MRKEINSTEGCDLYDDRALRHVDIDTIRFIDGPGAAKVGLSVTITFEPAAEFSSGPSISFSFSAPADRRMTVDSIEMLAIERTHALLQRLAREDVRTLRALLHKPA